MPKALFSALIIERITNMRKYLALLSALVITVLLTASVNAVKSFDSTYDYSSKNANDGIVDRQNTATLSTTTFSGNNSVMVTPEPNGNPDKSIVIDHYSVSTLAMSASDIKYISIYCYYAGSSDIGQPYVHLMRQNSNNILSAPIVYSDEPLEKGKWQWLTFDVGSALHGIVARSGAILSQFHYYPYGNTLSGELKASDTMYIAKIRYTSYDKLPSSGIARYKLRFENARPDVTGEDPEPILASAGEVITIPQSPYTRKDYTFDGWICSADNQVYQPGELYTVKERARVKTGVGSSSYITGEAIFFPNWKFSGSTKSLLPDTLTVHYADYNNGIVNHSDAAVYTNNFYFDDRRTVKLEPNTSSNNPVNLDAWHWNRIPFDLDKYKYVAISYYYKSDNPVSDIVPMFRILQGSTGTLLPKQLLVNSESPLRANEWSFMTFDISESSTLFNPNVESHIASQIHLRVGGLNPASKFSSGDIIYIDSVTLFSEKPEGTLVRKNAIMKGNGNGLFRPRDTLTRAEAAQLFYNIATDKGLRLPANLSCSFSDVKSTDWFYNAVALLEAARVLPSDSLFRPGDEITHSELALWLTNLSLGFDKKDATFGYGSTQPITRGEAAATLFDFLGLEPYDAIDKILLNLYDDVTPSIWEYDKIMSIASPRVSSVKDGKEEVVYFLTDGNTAPDYNTLEGYSKIKELDILEGKRIAEIRATESVYSTNNNGRIFYVSSSGGSTSGGDSADNPLRVSTLNEVASKLSERNGDVILFKRGDTFRGQLSTTVGVTYSAYGDVADGKPIFIRGPRNYADASLWTEYLNKDGKIIWKIEGIPGDAGAIVIDDGKIVGLKEIPSYLNGGYYVRGNTSVPFDIATELDRNHEFFHHNPPTGTSVSTSSSGTVYFRCDEGNPGELFEDIEFNINGNIIAARDNVTIDNLCLKYFGSHGIGAGTVQNLKVTNCEIGYGGGSIQFYRSGSVTRFGNGIEIYGGLLNYEIDNCYVYEIYDAGITHQISSSASGNYYMRNVTYRNNVLCDSTYNIEYFMSKDDANTHSERFMENVLFESNLIRRAGYGWGQQRPDPAPAGIKGWGHNNTCFGYILRDNIIDRCYNDRGGLDHLIQLGSTYVGATAYLDSNTFIQVPGRDFSLTDVLDADYNLNLPNVLSRIGGKDNVFYFAPEDNGKKFN